MHSFALYLKNDLELIVKGENMIDACLRAGKGIDYKQVKSYREDGGNLVQFSK